MYIQSICLIIMLTFTSCVVQNLNQKAYDYDAIEIIIKVDFSDTAFCEIRKSEEGIFYSFKDQNSSNNYSEFVSKVNLNQKELVQLNTYIWSKSNKVLKEKNLLKPLSVACKNKKAVIIAVKYTTSEIYVYKINAKKEDEIIRRILRTLPDYPLELEYILSPPAQCSTQKKTE